MRGRGHVAKAKTHMLKNDDLRTIIEPADPREAAFTATKGKSCHKPAAGSEASGWHEAYAGLLLACALWSAPGRTEFPLTPWLTCLIRLGFTSRIAMQVLVCCQAYVSEAVTDPGPQYAQHP